MESTICTALLWVFVYFFFENECLYNMNKLWIVKFQWGIACCSSAEQWPFGFCNPVVQSREIFFFFLKVYRFSCHLNYINLKQIIGIKWKCQSQKKIRHVSLIKHTCMLLLHAALCVHVKLEKVASEGNIRIYLHKLFVLKNEKLDIIIEYLNMLNEGTILSHFFPQ